MTERYDGYGNSIKRVMDNRSHEKGLLGVVADIIKVEKNMRQPLRRLLAAVSRILLQITNRQQNV